MMWLDWARMVVSMIVAGLVMLVPSIFGVYADGGHDVVRDVSGRIASAGAGSLQGRRLGDDVSVPERPFRGIVNYVSRRVAERPAFGPGFRNGRSWYDGQGHSWFYWDADTGEWQGDFLQFWNAETGEFSEVLLGPSMACPGDIGFVDGHVRFWTVGMGGELLTYVVPWGEDAYPYLLPPDSETRFHPHSGPGPFLDGDLELVYEPGGLRAALNGQEAFYSTLYDSHRDGYYGLVLRDSVEIDESPGEEFRHWAPVVAFDGTDGRRWGFRLIHSEPACVDQETYIVDGDTGEVVACGHRSGGGARLVNHTQPQAPVGDFALPRSTSPGDCDEPLDLRDIAGSVVGAPLEGTHQ